MSKTTTIEATPYELELLAMGLESLESQMDPWDEDQQKAIADTRRLYKQLTGHDMVVEVVDTP